MFKEPKDADERAWVKGWEEEFAAVEKQLEVSEGDDSEMRDLNPVPQVKMEFSRSAATTMTTQPEEYENDDLYEVVRDLRAGRDVILID